MNISTSTVSAKSSFETSIENHSKILAFLMATEKYLDRPLPTKTTAALISAQPPKSTMSTIAI